MFWCRCNVSRRLWLTESVILEPICVVHIQLVIKLHIKLDILLDLPSYLLSVTCRKAKGRRRHLSVGVLPF